MTEWAWITSDVAISPDGRVKSRFGRGHFLVPRFMRGGCYVRVKDPDNPGHHQYVEVGGPFEYFFGIDIFDEAVKPPAPKGRAPRPVHHHDRMYMSVSDAAEQEGISVRTVYRRIERGIDGWGYGA